MMTVTTIAAPTQQRRRRLCVVVAVLVTSAIGAVLSLAVNSGTQKAAPGAPTKESIQARPIPRAMTAIMSLTPARLAAGALGLGYTLPSAQRGPTTASVLASMAPETRRYTKAIMALTFAQLAAGAAGSP
jgi:hypothetical protein